MSTTPAQLPGDLLALADEAGCELTLTEEAYPFPRYSLICERHDDAEALGPWSAQRDVLQETFDAAWDHALERQEAQK